MVIEFKYLSLLISVAPPISFSSSEELFSKPTILFSDIKIFMNKHIIIKARLRNSKKRKAEEKRYEEKRKIKVSVGMCGNNSTEIFIDSSPFLTNSFAN